MVLSPWESPWGPELRGELITYKKNFPWVSDEKIGKSNGLRGGFPKERLREGFF